MTRLIFFPEENIIVQLESLLAASELVDAVTAGQWRPPAPYDDLGHSLSAVRLGKMVVVAACPHPGENSMRPPQLSRRQCQVLQLMAGGLTTKEIAGSLGLKTRTVSKHIAAIKNHFGATTRAQSVSKAISLGMLDAPGSI